MQLHEDEQCPPPRTLGTAGRPSTRVWQTLTPRLSEDSQAGNTHGRASRVLHLVLDRAPEQDTARVLEAAFGDAALAQHLLTGSTHARAAPLASWHRLVHQAWVMASPPH